MRLAPLFAALVLAGLSTARAEDAAVGGDAARDLKTLERAWGDAVVKRDTAAIDRTLADDYVLTTPEGRIVTKAQILKTFQAPSDPSFVIKSVDLGEMRIRVFGDVAVVSSRFTLRVQTEEGNVETPFRHTDVFVKGRGGWRCEARQATRIRQSYGHDPAERE